MEIDFFKLGLQIWLPSSLRQGTPSNMAPFLYHEFLNNMNKGITTMANHGKCWWQTDLTRTTCSHILAYGHAMEMSMVDKYQKFL